VGRDAGARVVVFVAHQPSPFASERPSARLVVKCDSSTPAPACAPVAAANGHLWSRVPAVGSGCAWRVDTRQPAPQTARILHLCWRPSNNHVGESDVVKRLRSW
jgi:hypothetical protein